MMKNKAGWVALIVLAIATVAMIFFVLPRLEGAREVTDAKLPVTADVKPADPAPAVEKPADVAKTDEKPVEAKPQDVAKIDPQPLTVQPPEVKPEDANPAETKPADAAQTDGKPADTAAASTVPSFDVLRVEPDGSTVIAGRAEPNTKLEIVNGDAVVATADVGKTGDFAAILDKPLEPGDYQLTLRSVGQDGATKASEEVATVSIPKDKASDLLAMVSRPGEASRIITTPEAVAQLPAVTTPKNDATVAPAGEVVAPGKSGRIAEEQKPTETAQANTTAVTSVPDASATKPVLVISAVELEGRKIFIAGSARAAALIRVYADDASVGEAKAEADGHFVVDGVIDLTVGRHIIRADMIGADGKVEFRASVPFDRPTGDQVAAVAQPDTAAAAAALEDANFEGLRADVGKAFAILKGLFAGGKTPSAEELAAARSATEISLGALADFKVGETIDAAMKSVVTATAKAAADALALLKAVPPDAASVSAALSRIEAAMASIVAPTANAADTPAAISQAATPAPIIEQPQNNVTTSASEPQTVEQAPLQQSRSSVIIRRGDTLWQISRRVYGAGVRYTTIYVANEDQIIDPDKILPGQVFGVPDKALPDAESEEIHRKRVKHQL